MAIRFRALKEKKKKKRFLRLYTLFGCRRSPSNTPKLKSRGSYSWHLRFEGNQVPLNPKPSNPPPPPTILTHPSLAYKKFFEIFLAATYFYLQQGFTSRTIVRFYVKFLGVVKRNVISFGDEKNVK